MVCPESETAVLKGLSFFVVHRYPDISVFLRNGDHRAGVRGRGVLDQAGSQILVEHSAGLFGEDRVDAVRAGVYGGHYPGGWKS